MVMTNIDLEGLDGAGKSTQANLLLEYYRLKGSKVKCIHFPTRDDEYLGRIAGHYLDGRYGSVRDVDPELISLAYATDRKMISSKLYSWGKYKYTLILDRYVESNCAYQGAKINDMDRREDFRKWVREFEYDFFRSPKPTVALYLDVPLPVIESRLKAMQEGGDIHEVDMSFQEDVAKSYMEICSEGYLNRIDCSDGNGGAADKMVVFDRILSAIKVSRPLIYQR